MLVEEIITQITPIFKNELEEDTLVLTPETTANDVESWDSITNIQLIVAVEKFYKIRFTSREIQDFKNVGELCACIISKTMA
jgi:acyl carrier protein